MALRTGISMALGPRRHQNPIACCPRGPETAPSPMVNAKLKTGEVPGDRGTGTLGDLLSADKARARVPEQDWVELVRAVAAGDQSALRALYERTHALVFTLTMRITGNRQSAEELTLDVFHDVWKRGDRYDPADGTVLGWIMNQARSRAIDRVRFDRRKKRSSDQAEDAAAQAAEPDTAELLDVEERARLLRDAFAALTLNERQEIEAAYISGLTYSEVAAQLHQPLGTIKTRIRSALRKLRVAISNGVQES